MADKRHVVRQWLETDAALGVSDAPLRVSVRSVSVAKGHPAARPAAAVAPRSSMPETRPVVRPVAATATVPAPRPAPPVVKSAASIPEPAGGVGRKAVAKTPLPPMPAGDIAALPPLTRRQKEEALEALRRELEAACQPLLNEIASRLVFGEGDPDADLMFVGEGPGIEEDRTGRPFVGRSGQLLDKMIAAIGYTRPDVYIGNVVKLRCADFDETRGRLQDRPPNPEEVARGLPMLHRQIAIIRPKVIVTLGAPAVKYLTGTTQGVMSIRGTWLSYRGIPVMPTYHPSFVLRAYTTENRAKVWSDLKAAAGRVKGK